MYGMYPPPMWYGPPQNNQMDHQTLERGMRIAMKIAQREDREKERKKINERKEKAEHYRQAAASRARFWLGVELFIFGILAQPFVMYGYNHMLKAVTP